MPGPAMHDPPHERNHTPAPVDYPSNAAKRAGVQGYSPSHPIHRNVSVTNRPGAVAGSIAKAANSIENGQLLSAREMRRATTCFTVKWHNGAYRQTSYRNCRAHRAAQSPAL